MSTPISVVVIGAGGHALVVAEILQLMGHHIVGFIDETDPQRCGEMFGGACILGGMDKLSRLLADGVQHSIVAIGHCQARMRIADKLCERGLTLINAIHPSAIVSPQAELGKGCVIAAQAAVNPNAHLGSNVIVNTGATVDHECYIAAGVHLGPGVHIAGKVTVGAGTWIGIGSTVIDRITIGEGAFIGAGSVVIRNIPDGMLAYGVPARIIRRMDK